MSEAREDALDRLLRDLAAAPEDPDVPGLVRPGITLADRFEVRRQLGAGGMGRVFAAYDRVRGERVALKALGCLAPRYIAHLKREFRSVAELVHPNLVRCHELFSDGPEWFFTMDLVDGVTLPELLEGRAGAARWEAVREVFGQLAAALTALHEAGMIHADLKPSNFLIRRADRAVVLLDFGLARPFGRPGLRERIGGTPGFMAPEQGGGETLTEAVDWYAYGVVLHHALTGEPPGAVRSGAALDGAPHDLARLCVELVSPRPLDRPRGVDVLRRLACAGPPRAPPPARPGASELVGREEELAALGSALERTASGQPAVVVLQGPSGIGKTTLATAFASEVRRRGGLVLAGRCRERESMAFKAVDGLVDDLVAALDGLSAEEAAAVLPAHLAELTTVFPELREAEVVARAPTAGVDLWERGLVRARAFEAFADLLANLRRRAPLLVWIDDLQWSDAESALLLGPVLGGARPVPLLFVGTCRAGAGAAGSPAPLLEAIYADAELSPPPQTALRLGALDEGAARRLALALLGELEPEAEARAQDIAQETEGHPLFIVELSHHAGGADGSSPGAPAPATLQELIVRRVGALPRGARRMLELAAVAGAPLPRGVLRRTQGATFGEAEASLELLKASRLVRTEGVKEDDAVDVHHDRIRDIVVHGLGEGQRRRRHLALARVLEARPDASPEFVAVHFEAAGEGVLASGYWLRAADDAARALAFGHAAELYERGLRHAALEPSAARAVQVRRAEALARAGKGPAAADAYLATAATCGRDEALELRRHAAEQLLLTGHIDRGLAVVEEVLRAVGMRETRAGYRGLASLLAGRLRVRARGFRYVPRAEHELSREEVARLDTSWVIACSLGSVDFIRGADFHNEHILLALRSGEPTRLLRALTLEASYSATPGAGSGRTARLLALADELARSGADASAVAFLGIARGVVAYLQGDLALACAQLEKSMEVVARVGGTPVCWEMLTALRFLIASLFFLGRMGRLRDLVARLLADAEGTGNVYASMCFRTGYSCAAWLARDDVAEARAQMQRASEEWSVGGFQLAHYNMLVAETYLDLYNGDAERALSRLQERWPQVRAAQLLRIAVTRAQLLQVRSASAAASADHAERRGQRVRARALRQVARGDARRLGGERIARARPWAALVEAALACSEGDARSMAARLDEAASAFDEQGMLLYAAAARVRRGQCLNGPGAASSLRRGLAALAAEGVANPDRMVAMLAPGFGRVLSAPRGAAA